MLSILGLVFILIAVFYTYKTAQESERNPILWAFISLVTGLGLQIAFPFVFGVMLVIYWLLSGYDNMEEIEASVSYYMGLISILGLILSGAGMLMVLRYASRMKEIEFIPPPAPPKFD